MDIQPEFKICERCQRYRTFYHEKVHTEYRLCVNRCMAHVEDTEPYSWVTIPNDCDFVLEQLLMQDERETK